MPTPLGWYQFEGNGLDSSGNGHHLTMAAGATFGTGKKGQGLILSGANDQYGSINPGPLDTTQSYTVMAWCKCAAIPAEDENGDRTFIARAGVNASAFYLRMSRVSGGQVARFAVVAADVTGTLTYYQAPDSALIPAGTWVHLAGVYDATAGTAALYVNAVLTGTAASVAGTFAATGPLYVGVGWQDAGASFDPPTGAMDEARIYQAALTQQEIQDAIDADNAVAAMSLLILARARRRAYAN